MNKKTELFQLGINRVENRVIKRYNLRETLIKAFPSLDLRCEAANSFANPCDPPEVFKEMLI